MTSTQLEERTERSENLKVFQMSDHDFYVENSKGNICYRVRLNGNGKSCTCGDYTANEKKDPEFMCKHIIAAINSNGNCMKIGPMVDANSQGDEPRGFLGVYQAISAVQMSLAKMGIQKTQTNKFDKYPFRGIDDVYNALAPLLAQNKLCILPRMISRTCEERTSQKGGALFYVTVDAEFDFVAASDGSIHTVRIFGEAMDRSDKATNKAMSAAYKYACFQAFCIPVEGDNDADFTSHEVKEKTGKPAEKKPSKPSPVPKAQAKKEEKPEKEPVEPKKTKPKQASEPKPKEQPEDKKSSKTETSKGNGNMSPAQAKAIQNLAKRRGIKEDQLKEMSETQYGVPLDQLPAKDASAFIRHLQQAA